MKTFYGILVACFFVISIWTIPKLINSYEEISKEQYQKVLSYTIKYPTLRFLVQDKLSDDLKISNYEFEELTRIYQRIELHSSVPLLLQEKAHGNLPESSD